MNKKKMIITGACGSLVIGHKQKKLITLTKLAQ